ncbi:hypothetical protein HAX54_041706 [Datura stramonium]|uniref:Protein kinase domain-containing protein n=1 Tax=Datura stramonium TaxID=4076 RepID=A0ABS8VZE3_DATST|nr:hypothetical protein [Datura stramonium]
MGCSFSGLNALYDTANGGGDVWINENRFRILKPIGEGAFANVFLVKEVPSDPSNPGISKRFKDPSHVSVVNDLVGSFVSIGLFGYDPFMSLRFQFVVWNF